MLLGQDVALFLFLIALAWLLALSIWIYRKDRTYSRLVSLTSKTDLKSILDQLLKQLKESEEQSVRVKNAIQKIGLVRFNPFGDTGGDQSFALCLLDGRDSGIVILSLHLREGTRVYVKRIKEGKSRYELSKEEKQAIDEARK